MKSAWQALARCPEAIRSLPDGNFQERQYSWLLNCLRRNAATKYGARYDFENIESPDEYRKNVPLVTYEDILPMLEQLLRGEKDILFKGPAVAFEETGGSQGQNKLIPYSSSSLDDFRTALRPWLSELITTHGLTDGSLYVSVSPDLRKSQSIGKTEIPLGLSDAAYLGDDTALPLHKLSVVPHWIKEVFDVREWQLATLYSLVRHDDLALISVWSPTFFMNFLELLSERSSEIEFLLSRGGSVSTHRLDADRAALQRFRDYLAVQDTAVLWPRLKLVSCWRDASSKPFFHALEKRLSHAAFQPKGIIATEGVVTVPDREGHPLLAADSGFFEFLDAGDRSLLSAELDEGKEYEIVMTTAGGLYRYRTGDCVLFEGYRHGIPELRFTGRKGLCSDIVGEKLTEAFVASCLDSLPGFRMLIPVLKEKPGYMLVIDALQREGYPDHPEKICEHLLFRNPQYRYARNVGQLDSLQLLLVKRPMQRYIDYMVNEGMKPGDIKVPALRPEMHWVETFMKERS